MVVRVVLSAKAEAGKKVELKLNFRSNLGANGAHVRAEDSPLSEFIAVILNCDFQISSKTALSRLHYQRSFHS